MLTWLATHPTPLAAAVTLSLLWLLESLAPFFSRRGGVAHDARNVTLGVLNGLVRATFFPAALLGLATLGEQHGWGLLRWLDLPAWAAALIAVLVLDLVTFGWHVASHKAPLLWRFHLVHHHDNAVNASTAFRFHTGDVLLSGLTTLAAAAVLGLRVEHVLLYEALLLPVSIFHHANIAVPERLDRALRTLIVTPRMHWVHHSRWQEETDSNYAGLFSFWDRLFRTFRLRDDPATLAVGLDGYTRAIQDTLRGCLLTPFQPLLGRSERAPEPAAPAGTRVRGTRVSNEGSGATDQLSSLASPSTHPSRGRHLPLALAVFSHTPPPPGRAAAGRIGPARQDDPRPSPARTAMGTLRPCPTEAPTQTTPAARAIG